MELELSSPSRILTVAYLLLGVPLMFVYLKATGGLLAKAICLLANHIPFCNGKSTPHGKSLGTINKVCAYIAYSFLIDYQIIWVRKQICNHFIISITLFLYPWYSCKQNKQNSATSLCYSTALSSTASSSVNNSNSNIVSSPDMLDRGERQVRYLLMYQSVHCRLHDRLSIANINKIKLTIFQGSIYCRNWCQW